MGMSRIYEKMNDFRNSLGYFQKYAAIQDSLINMESNRQIAEMQTIYDTEKKNFGITAQKIEIEEQKNEMVSADEMLTPDMILNKLRDKVIKELGASGGETKDGMDISLAA